MTRPAALPEAEAGFQAAVLELAAHHGWRRQHTRPARTRRGWRTPLTGEAGFPDLVLVRPPRLILAECKTDRGQPSPEQRAWLEALTACGLEVYVWRPRDFDRIATLLR